jgi:hypothetical protein
MELQEFLQADMIEQASSTFDKKPQTRAISIHGDGTTNNMAY